jgi:ketosteroid isomerase-like protein
VPLAEDDLIERLRRTYELFNAEEFDAAVEMAHPDIVFVRPGAQSELRGADAFARVDGAGRVRISGHRAR